MELGERVLEKINDYQVIVPMSFYKRCERTDELEKEIARLRSALEKIVKHQIAVAGSLYPMSIIYNIAQQALGKEEK